MGFDQSVDSNAIEDYEYVERAKKFNKKRWKWLNIILDIFIGGKYKNKMADYFNTFAFHIQGLIDLDVKKSFLSGDLSKMCSIGTDDIICWKDMINGEKKTK